MKFRPIVAAFGLGLIATVVQADAEAPASAERGKVLAYTCHGCHGVENYKNAYPNYRVPKLGGQSTAYLAAALRGYANGERPHQTMHSQAVTLSEQDRRDIAAYLQGEQQIQPRTEVVGTPPQASQTCVACHGADGAKTAAPDYPILAGQYPDYIEQALKDYKSGRRKNPVMAGIAAGIDEKDFEALADFFGQQHGLCSTDDIRDAGACQVQ